MKPEQLLLPYDGEYQPEWALRSGGNIWSSPAYEDEGENARH